MKLSSSDDEYRFRVFEKNVKEINEHNAKPDETYKMGINKFTGLSKQEFQETYLGHFEPHSSFDSEKVETPLVGLAVDWVSFGAVSPVKNEGQCLANYAFSAVGAIEGISAIVFKQQTEYSAQELVDCSGNYGNSGCNGGSMDNSFAFVGKRGIFHSIQVSIHSHPILMLDAFKDAKLPQVFSRSATHNVEETAQAWNSIS